MPVNNRRIVCEVVQSGVRLPIFWMKWSYPFLLFRVEESLQQLDSPKCLYPPAQNTRLNIQQRSYLELFPNAHCIILCLYIADATNM